MAEVFKILYALLLLSVLAFGVSLIRLGFLLSNHDHLEATWNFWDRILKYSTRSMGVLIGLLTLAGFGIVIARMF